MAIDLRWQNFLNKEMKKEYMGKLAQFIKERRAICNVLPEPNQLFNAFTPVNWDLLKVVIIGNEPYPSREHTHGLAFSSISSTAPAALTNIFHEIYQDIYQGNTGGQKVHWTNNLTQWADQGVLLLNSCLTTEEKTPGAHKGKGWELFIENTVKLISERHHFKIVFLLWGKDAKQYAKYIDTTKHLILESEHPAAGKHNEQSWFGNKHFSQANQFISKHYFNQRGLINWGTWIKRQ